MDKYRIIYPHNQKLMLRANAHGSVILKTCHSLALRGHKVYFLMGKTTADTNGLLSFYGLEPNPNLHLVQLPILRKAGRFGITWSAVFNYFCLMTIRKMRREGLIDLVYMRETALAHFLLKWNSCAGLPFVCEVHGLMAPGYRKPDRREQTVFRNCHTLVTTTESLRKVVEEIYSPSVPILKVPLAAHCPEGLTAPFTPPGPGESWRIGYIGQLYPLQGVELVVRALSILPERVVFNVIGGKEEHIDGLRQIAESLGVGHRVCFHGFVPPGEVAVKAAENHIFIAPSLPQQKMPFVAYTKIYEYMALGRTVIAADLPSIREEIEDGVNGLLFKAGDYTSLAEAVRKLTSNPALAATAAREGLEYIRSFSWQRRAEMLESCFFNAVQRASSRQESDLLPG